MFSGEFPERRNDLFIGGFLPGVLMILLVAGLGIREGFVTGGARRYVPLIQDLARIPGRVEEAADATSIAAADGEKCAQAAIDAVFKGQKAASN